MADIIEILVDEHTKISEFIDKLEQKCIDFMEENIVDLDGLREDIVFIRTFADATHHKKEEDILFKVMVERLGNVAQKLIQNGMLVEHDLARLHVMELENAINSYEKTKSVKDKLAIIANAMGYCFLLRRHIDKENGVVYPFAKRSLSEDVIEELTKEALIYKKDE